MQKIIENIYLGNKKDYEKIKNKTEWAFVHASKGFYDQAVKNPNIEMTSNFYILENHFYTDWVDQENLNLFKKPSFIKAMDFVDSWKKEKDVLIHCDYGQSRSPSLVMLYLAKRTNLLENSFFSALEKFKQIYPDYFFPSGISRFIKDNWNELN